MLGKKKTQTFLADVELPSYMANGLVVLLSWKISTKDQPYDPSSAFRNRLRGGGVGAGCAWVAQTCGIFSMDGHGYRGEEGTACLSLKLGWSVRDTLYSRAKVFFVTSPGGDRVQKLQKEYGET